MREEKIMTTEGSKEVRAIAKMREEMEHLNRYESAMVCGMIEMMEYTVKQDESLQDTVLASNRSALGCLYGLLAAMSKNAPSTLELVPPTPFGKIEWKDFSKRAVKEIVNFYYKGE